MNIHERIHDSTAKYIQGIKEQLQQMLSDLPDRIESDVLQVMTRDDDIDIAEILTVNLMLDSIDLREDEYIIYSMERITYTINKSYYHYDSQIVTNYGNVYDGYARRPIPVDVGRERAIDIFSEWIKAVKPKHTVRGARAMDVILVKILQGVLCAEFHMKNSGRIHTRKSSPANVIPPIVPSARCRRCKWRTSFAWVLNIIIDS